MSLTPGGANLSRQSQWKSIPNISFASVLWGRKYIRQVCWALRLQPVNFGKSLHCTYNTEWLYTTSLKPSEDGKKRIKLPLTWEWAPLTNQGYAVDQCSWLHLELALTPVIYLHTITIDCGISAHLTVQERWWRLRDTDGLHWDSL